MAKTELRVANQFFSKQTTADGLTIERLRTIVQDSHINFLLGAGTSAAFFPPLGDIEKVLTEIAAYEQDLPEAKIARASIQGYFFDKILAPNISLVERTTEAEKIIQSYVRFLRVLNHILLKRRSTLLGKQANIFTTNVDMAIEVACEALEIDMNDGFLGRLRPRLDLGEYGTLRIRQGTRYEYRSEIPVVNLFKIHGSVSWLQMDGEIIFDHKLLQIEETKKAYDAAKNGLVEISDYSALKLSKLVSAARDKTYSDVIEEFAIIYNTLSIVNPEKTKFATTVLNKTYYELIRRFSNELEKENSVLFVHGFSFRDEHLRDLALRAARTNPTLQVVVFCYSRQDRENLRLLILDEHIKNDNIVFVAPNIPEGETAERKMDIDVLVEDFLAPLIEISSAVDHVVNLNIDVSTNGESNA